MTTINVQNTLARDIFSTFKRVPSILQSEAAECGLACITMIAQFYGDKRDLNMMRQVSSVSMRGTTLKDIITVAHHLGFRSRAIKVELEDLSKITLPAIIHWDLNHFVVLVAVSNDEIEINDPAQGKRVLSFEEASRHVTGIALEVYPTADFAPRPAGRKISFSSFLNNSAGMKHSLIVLLSLSIVLQVLAIASPYYMQTVVDDVLIYNNDALLHTLAIGFGLLLIIECATAALRKIIILSVSTRLQLHLSSSVFKHLLSLPLDYFSNRHVGDVVSRFSSLSHIREFLTTGVVSAILDGIMAVLTITVMAIYSIKLTLVVLAVIFVSLCIKAVILPFMQRITTERIALSANEQSYFMETVRAVMPIRVYQQEAHRLSHWQNKLVAMLNKDVLLGKINIGSSIANQFLFAVENLLVVYIGALLTMEHTLTIGMLLAFIAYKTRFVNAINGVINSLISYKMLNVHFDRVSDILLTKQAKNRLITRKLGLSNCHSALVSAHTDAHPILIAEQISFKFSVANELVVDALNLSVKRGESIAIVGASGTGKSTLLKCLMGLYTLTSGSITMFYNETRPPKVAAVLQDDSCLSGTIAENICCFDSAPDLEKIVTAAQLACIHEEIIAMPMQYHSLVGDMGSSLSGGQRQRILLARALYQSPDILFLDEASSHLDTVNETRINQHLNTLNITRIIVAHRPQTIAVADKVYHLKNGKLYFNSPAEVQGQITTEPYGE